jgi:uncharacterized protein YoxC
MQMRLSKVLPSRDEPGLAQALSSLADASAQVGGALDALTNANMNMTPQVTDAIGVFSKALVVLNESVDQYGVLQYSGYENIVEWKDEFINSANDEMAGLTEKISDNVEALVQKLTDLREDVNASADQVSSALKEAQTSIDDVFEAAAAAAEQANTSDASLSSQRVVWGDDRSLTARSTQKRKNPRLPSGATSLDATVARKGGANPCDGAKNAIAQANRSAGELIFIIGSLNKTVSSLSSTLVEDAADALLKVNDTVMEALSTQFVEKNDVLTSALSTDIATFLASTNINETEQGIVTDLGPKLRIAEEALEPLLEALEAMVANVTTVCEEMQT